MATIYDVAKRAKVSTYTVSSVINRSAYVSPELTKRVLSAVRALNYTVNDVARSLQTRRTKLVGMLIPDISNPFYAVVVRAVEERLRRDGYTLILGSTYDDPKGQAHYLQIFSAKQVDGFLLFPAPNSEADLAPLVATRKPIVFVGRRPLASKIDSVHADNVVGTSMAVEHLIAEGHKRIALIVGLRSLASNIDRVEGWRSALRKAKLPAPETLIGEGNLGVASGQACMDNWLDKLSPARRPTAFFAANFLMVAGAIRSIRAHGLSCPADVVPMSCDDYDWLDAFEPRISTVAQPAVEMGELAADLLLKRIEEPGRKPQSTALSPSLHIRT